MEFTYTECIVEGYLKACEEFGWLTPTIERLYEISIEKNGRKRFEDFVEMDAEGIKAICDDLFADYMERKAAAFPDKE